MSLTQEEKDTIREEFDEFLDKFTGKHHEDSIYAMLFADTVKVRKDLILKKFDELLDQAYQQGAKDKVEEVRESIDELYDEGDGKMLMLQKEYLLKRLPLKDNT